MATKRTILGRSSRGERKVMVEEDGGADFAAAGKTGTANAEAAASRLEA